MKFNFYYIFALRKKKGGCISPLTAMPANFIHFQQKVDIKNVLESSGQLKKVLFTRFYPHSSIFIFTQCNAIAYI